MRELELFTLVCVSSLNPVSKIRYNGVVNKCRHCERPVPRWHYKCRICDQFVWRLPNILFIIFVVFVILGGIFWLAF